MGNYSDKSQNQTDLNNNEVIDSKSVQPDDVFVNLSEKDLETCIWRPKESDIESSSMSRFQKLIIEKYQAKIDNYDALYKWSIENSYEFWEEVWNFTNIIHSTPYTQVLDKKNESIDNLPFEWFNGALLNYSENLLRYDDEKIALYSSGEAFSKTKSITFKDLRKRVGIYQKSLKKLGIKSGDVVVGYLPNCIECVEAKLAVISLGAVWSCAPPDFGAQAVIDRFNQIEPRILFSVTSVAYNGKKHDQIKKLTDVINKVDSIERVVIVPFYNNTSDDIIDIPKSTLLDDFLVASCEKETETYELTFEQVSFNHPMVILYSSGTTGTPKCIVHSHGGTLIQHLKEHVIHANMTRDDIILYYTSTGWMMYDWLLTSLSVGATVVLFDGSPVLPTIDVLWNLIDSLKITIFGTSAKYLSVIEEKMHPKISHDLSSLRIIYSTGSPLKPTTYDYVYSSIKSDVCLASITGGSDIISCFMCGNTNIPVYRGELQCRALGMSIECWNEDGKPVYNECGELVCTKPFPSMPIYFFKDEQYVRYKASYFEKNPGVWTHGDFCMINSMTGGVTMLGRSDGTLNPNGIRFGSADIYNIVETFEEIVDSLCVGQKNPESPEDERVILFIKLRDGIELNKNLIDRIKINIRTSLSPRHVPSLILRIDDIPYTINGKKVEVPVRKIIEGSDMKISASLLNPKSLDFFRNLEELKKW